MVGHASSSSLPVAPSGSLPPAASAASCCAGGGTGAGGGGEAVRGLLPEQSPAARSSKAPSEPPSEFSSWHDDASLATLSAGDRTITVNMQRTRMGEHLKGKLQGMIRQRFENYLRIIQTLQNDTGKVTALVCELRVPPHMSSEGSVRTSISCNEDGTFLVYLLPDVSAGLGFDSPAGPSSGRASSSGASGRQGAAGSDAAGAGSPGGASASSGAGGGSGGSRGDGGAASPADSSPIAAAAVKALAEEVAPAVDGRELLRRWAAQVCEFGMTGRCHSLTALFHFGYTAWKQLLGDGWEGTAGDAAHHSGDVADVQGLMGRTSPAAGHVEEEEEDRDRQDEQRGCTPQRVACATVGGVTGGCGTGAPSQSMDDSLPPLTEQLPAGASEARLDQRDTQSALPLNGEPYPLARALSAARRAADCERHQLALDLCAEGIALARSAPMASCGSGSGAASSSAAPPPRPVMLAFAADECNEGDAASILWQLFLLRASTLVQLRGYDLALLDAEELISLQPTYADGYYWQSVALQGLGRGQEALEALMSALEYEPQNPTFQQAFTSLFEDISAASEEGLRSPHSSRHPHPGGPASASAAGAAAPPTTAAVLPRRPRGGLARDALSTTTQATHLSSRSTTPTEVSEPLSPRSSSNDTLSVAGAAFEDTA